MIAINRSDDEGFTVLFYILVNTDDASHSVFSLRCGGFMTRFCSGKLVNL